MVFSKLSIKYLGFVPIRYAGLKLNFIRRAIHDKYANKIVEFVVFSEISSEGNVEL